MKYWAEVNKFVPTTRGWVLVGLDVKINAGLKGSIKPLALKDLKFKNLKIKT